MPIDNGLTMACKECPVSDGTNGPVSYKGPLDADVVVLGAAPTPTDITLGSLFTGPTGELLYESLQDAGFNENKILYCNTIACAPDSGKVNKKMITQCSDHVITLINSSPRKLIIALGNEANYVAGLLTKIGGITKIAGNAEKSSVFNGVDTFACINPTNVLKGGTDRQVFKLHILNAYRHYTGKAKPTIEPDITTITKDNINECLDRIMNANVVAFDCETYPNHLPFCVGFALSDTEAYYLPFFEHGVSMWEDTSIPVNFIRKICNHPGTMVAHNAAFDIMALRTMFNLDWTANYIDTMITAHLLDEEIRTGLDVLCTTIFSVDNWKQPIDDFFASIGVVSEEKDAEEISAEKDYSKIPVDMVRKYVCQDCAATFMLYEYLETRMTDKLRKVRDNVDQPAAMALRKMERRGLKVDVDTLGEYEQHLEKEYDKLLKKLIAMVGTISIQRKQAGEYVIVEEEFNPRSVAHVQTYMFEVKDYPIIEHTETGAPSTGAKDVLVPLLKQFPDDIFIDTLLRFRTAKDTLDRFINGKDAGWKNMLDENGMIHPGYSVARVETGRTCVREDTQVETEDGPKEIKDVKVGDKVLTHKFRYMPVKNVVNKGPEEMVQIISSIGNKIWCTEGHQVLTGRGWTNAGDLKLRGSLIACKDDEPGLDKVSQIKYHNKRYDVWDIEVEEDSSYLANGMFHHNSSFHPNIQAQAKPMLGLIVPQPGYKFVYADLSQAELRVLALLANDKLMMQRLMEGDIHRSAAARVHGIPEEEVSKEQRSRVKPAVFGYTYGESAYTLARKLGTSVEEADKIQKDIFSEYIDVEIYQNQLREQVQRPPHTVESMFGRLRRLPDAGLTVNGFCDKKKELGKKCTCHICQTKSKKSHALREAVNFPIQSGAGDLLKIALAKVDNDFVDRGFDTLKPFDIAWLSLEIHDSLVAHVKEDYAEEVASIVENRMNFKIKDMQFEAEVEIKDRLEPIDFDNLTTHKELRE